MRITNNEVVYSDNQNYLIRVTYAASTLFPFFFFGLACSRLRALLDGFNAGDE